MTTRSGRLPPRARAARGSGGIGRTSSQRAERVSDDLRRGAGPMLDRRRRAAALLLAASGAMAAVSLYQLGILRHLPDPPGFDSDRVDASGEAYHSGSTPDAALALANYAVTLALVGMGGADRAQDRPLIPLAVAAKAALDAAGAALLTAEQVTKHEALCFYCLVAAGASAAVLPYTVPEARAAWRALRR